MSGRYPLPQLRRFSTRRDPLGLTVREREAAMALYSGHTAREAAELLGCKYETVRSLLKSVRRKLRVNSALGVVARIRLEQQTQAISEPFSEEATP